MARVDRFEAQKTSHRNLAYLVLKANAGQLPLGDNSVSLVLATPPYVGERTIRKGDYCTNDAEKYKALINSFLKEATRVVKPNGCILITPSHPPPPGPKGARRVFFRILQKKESHREHTSKLFRCEVFFTHYVNIEPMCWWAFPVSLYRILLRRYSVPGDTILHVFSGSGNGGIAALELRRSVILVDLLYHRRVLAKLNRKKLLLDLRRS